MHKFQDMKWKLFPKASPEIIHIANKSLLDMDISRDNREAVRIELAVGGVAKSKGERTSSVYSTSPSTMPLATSSFFVPRTTSGAQPSIWSVVKIEVEQEDNKLVGRCFL